MPDTATFIDTPGGRFRVRLDGPADAPVLMFSNSLGTPLELWDAQARRLPTRWRVLRYDTRGHGQSDVTPGPYTAAQLGGDAVALLDALGIGRAAFCGISMGGLTGLWLGLNAPQRLTHLVVANSAARIGSTQGWLDRAAQVRAQGKQAMAALATSAPSRWFGDDFVAAEPATVQRTQAWLAASPPEGYAACCEALAHADLRAELPRLGVPTLLIAGTLDPVTTVADAQAMQAAIPGARVAQLPASHLSNIEASDAFDEALQGFLAA